MTTMTQKTENLVNDSLTASQLFPLLFSFLDVNSSHTCKLVSKDWSQQITKCYESQELRLLSELYSLSQEINKDELDAEDISKINQLLVDTSKAMVFLQKSFMYDSKGEYRLRELMALKNPPLQLFNLFYSFVALIDPPKVSWKKVDGSDNSSSFIQLYHFGVQEQFRNLQENLNQPQFLFEITLDRVQKVENYFKERVFEPVRLRNIFYNSHYLGFWVVIMLKTVKLRLQLTEKARNIFDCIYLNTSFKKREELVKVNRYKEACNTWLLRKKYNQKILDYEKRLEELATRREKNHIESTVLNLAMQDLKIEMQEIQQSFKKQFLPPPKK